jgi:hypothetical protein
LVFFLGVGYKYFLKVLCLATFSKMSIFTAKFTIGCSVHFSGIKLNFGSAKNFARYGKLWVLIMRKMVHRVVYERGKSRKTIDEMVRIRCRKIDENA